LRLLEGDNADIAANNSSSADNEVSGTSGL
jgi:hypothetical protein